MADERKMHCNVDLEKFVLVEETLTWYFYISLKEI